MVQKQEKMRLRTIYEPLQIELISSHDNIEHGYSNEHHTNNIQTNSRSIF